VSILHVRLHYILFLVPVTLYYMSFSMFPARRVCNVICTNHWVTKPPGASAVLSSFYYIWVSPCGRPTCLHKQEVGKPSQNAAQPCASVQGYVNDDLRADGLQKGWGFRVSTWNVDSLTGRAGEVVEALSDRKVDVACIQEIWWKGNGCKFYAAKGKRYEYKLFWIGGEERLDGVGIFVAEKWVDSIVSV